MTPDRISHVQTLLKLRKADAILVTNPFNIYYLSGFMGVAPEERESVLLITTRNAFIFVPKLYELQVRGLELMQQQRIEVVIDEQRAGIVRLFGPFVAANPRILIEEENLNVSEFASIKKYHRAHYLSARMLVEQLRMQKDRKEVADITTAARITDNVFNTVLQLLRNNRTLLTEMDIVDCMRTEVRKQGGDGFGFNPIIAFGSNSCEPHYHPANVKLSAGALLFDIGMTYKKYTADLSRTIYLGSPPQDFKDAYALVLECNRMCLELCRPGVLASDIHAHAVRFFEAHGVREYFIHSLGHGVGLNIHERPFFGQGKESELKPGMIITIEPGLYFSGKFGIRIEDLVVITDNGNSVLSSNSPKELIEIEERV